MNILFIADPLESFKTHKDTTFAMMREAQRRGHTVAACEPQDVMWQRGDRVTAHVRDIGLTGDADRWFEERGARAVPLKDFDAILMRKDPPFDSEYFYATHLLEQAERDGARVFNKPGALRDHPEKLAIMEFPQFIGPTLVTRDEADIKRFHACLLYTSLWRHWHQRPVFHQGSVWLRSCAVHDRQRLWHPVHLLLDAHRHRLAEVRHARAAG